jgi:hypothetical protein
MMYDHGCWNISLQDLAPLCGQRASWQKLQSKILRALVRLKLIQDTDLQRLAGLAGRVERLIRILQFQRMADDRKQDPDEQTPRKTKRQRQATTKRKDTQHKQCTYWADGNTQKHMESGRQTSIQSSRQLQPAASWVISTQISVSLPACSSPASVPLQASLSNGIFGSVRKLVSTNARLEMQTQIETSKKLKQRSCQALMN